MHDSKFITDDDLIYFRNNDIDYNLDMPIFLGEMRAYLNEVWDEEYYIEQEFTIEELHSKHLLGYPSPGGSAILDDSFTGSCPTQLLSSNSKHILKYLYNIHLR